MSIRQQLSVKLKECKKSSGMTYEQLIEESGYSKTTIRYALNGGVNVSLEVFEKLFLCCGVNLLEIEVIHSVENW